MTKPVSSIIDASFVKRFAGAAQSGAASLAKSLTGAGQQASQTFISGLRYGAQIFARSIENLNSVTSFLNQSKSKLEELLEITDEMIVLAEKATKPGVANRRGLEAEFSKLERDFLDVLDDQEIGSFDSLDAEGIEEIFAAVGLDRKSSEEIAELFEKFILDDGGDTLLASLDTKADRPIRVPNSAFGPGVTISATGSTSKISDAAAQQGFVSSEHTNYEAVDTVIGEYPTLESLFIKPESGAVTGLQAGSGSGLPETVIESGGAEDVITADFDNDGKQDIATTTNNGTVEVVLGNGNGTFNDSLATFLSNGPVSLDVDDITENGNQDIVAADASGDIKILSGNGDGTFDITATISTGQSLTSATTADVNKDGSIDVLFTTGDGLIGFSAGNGDGTFGAVTTYSTTASSLDSARLEDIDKDGNLDLAASSAADDALYIALGNGDGTFGGATSQARGSITDDAQRNFDVADVDGDGNLDLVNTATGDDTIEVALGNGDGTFGAVSTFSAGDGAGGVVLTDHNQDGDLDAVVAAGNDGEVNVLLGNGDGTFGAVATSYTTSTGAVNLATTDFDGDGRVDTVAGNTTTGVLYPDLFQLGAAQDGSGTFQAVQTFGAGWIPRSVTLGDLNGDGVLDLVTANTFSDDTTVLLGNGDGTFQAAQTFGAGDGPYSVTLGDIDGDGELDIVTANYLSDDTTVLLGNGDGTFQASQAFDAGNHARSVSLGDVDGDGILDMVTANRDDSTASVLLGNGNGTFQGSQDFSTGSNPTSVSLGDVDGDGTLDLITANLNSDNVSVLLGNGNGTFQADQAFGAGNGPTSITFGDIDGDGTLDLVTANSIGDDTSVLLGNGNGTFQTAQAFGAGSGSYSVELVDLNGDGALDMITANRDSDDSSVLLGNGDGTFQAAETFGAGDGAFSISTGDLDGDGILDFVTANYGTGANDVTVLLGNGNALSQPTLPDSILQSGGAQDIVTGDFDNDGHQDFISTLNNGSIEVVIGNGNGTFRDPTPTFLGGAVESMSVADIDRDGNLDILASDENGVVKALTGNGDGTFAIASTVDTGDGVTSVTGKDIDKDGTIDVLYTADDGSIGFASGNGDGTFGAVSTYSTTASSLDSAVLEDVDKDGNLDYVASSADGNRVYVGLGNGDGTFEAATSSTRNDITNDAQRNLAVADIDNDGNLDVVNSSTGSNVFEVSLGNGDGTFGGATSYAAGDGIAGVVLNDYDQDGNLDLISAAGNDGETTVRLGNGDGTFGAVSTTVTTATGANTLAATDFDGDGRTDLLSGVSSSGVVYPDLFQLGAAQEGDGTFQSAQNYNAGDGSTSVSAGDLNGDGVLDLITTNYDSYNSTVLLGNGDGTFQAPQTFGTGYRHPYAGSLGDVDGDGVLDFVMTNFTANDVAVMIGNGDGTFQAVETFVTGFRPYSVSSGDLNGDGVLDLVTGNAFTNDASVLLGNGDGTFQAAQTLNGGNGERSVTLGDFDGDGALDLAIANYFSDDATILFGNGNGTFQSAQTFSTGNGASSITTGDLNGDGALDLITGNLYDNDATVLLGNGDGTFQAAQTSGTGNGPRSLELGDLNGDGTLDLVTANYDGDNSTVLIGNGDGTFQSAQTFGAGNGAQSVVLGDFDNDGITDFATANRLSDNVSILTGNATSLSQPTGGLENNIDLKAVNKSDGYSVISASDDFLGFNSQGDEQLFLVDDAGNIVHQLTNNTGTYSYGDVSIADDNLTVIAVTNDGTNDSVDLFEIGSLGEDPATSTVANLASGAQASVEYSNVEINSAGTYYAFYEDTSGVLNFADVATQTNNAGLAAMGDTSQYFGFVDTTVLAIATDNGSNYDIQSYSYSGSDYTSTYVSNVDLNGFSTLEQGSGESGFFTVSDSTDNDLKVYRTSDTSDIYFERNYEAGESSSTLSMARDSTGNVVLGVYGNLNSVDSDSDNEIYRVDLTQQQSGYELQRRESVFNGIFDSSRSITRRPDAYRMLADLEELKKQIEGNIEALNEATETIDSNIQLARATGFSMLDAADLLDGDEQADAVAKEVSKLVRQSGVSLDALNQLENLNGLAAQAIFFENQDS